MNGSFLSLAVRAGFVLLVAVLAAFEVLFIGERREGEAALERTRTLLEARAAEALDEALRGALDVALARIEVLETVPEADGEGLFWVEDGVQRLPRGERVEGEVPAGPGAQWLGGEWLVLPGVRGVRGVRVSLASFVEDVRETLLKRGALLQDDALGVSLGSGPRLVTVALRSPRLEAGRSALWRAFWLKSALLALTALLGLGVVFLERLARRRREETLEAQREFISTVSHELRTPLAGIRLLAETLERKLGSAPEARDYPRRLVAATDALGFLVENILSFNRIDSGRWTPKRERFALVELEQMLKEDAALSLEVPVEVQCTGLEGELEADPALIRILVLNLLRNAWKYGTRRPVRFEVRAEREAAGLRVRFTDNGPGIPRAQWERVFEPFHRLDGNTGGSGLGLALARRIAELHGGTLSVETSSEAGTTFTLALKSLSLR